MISEMNRAPLLETAGREKALSGTGLPAHSCPTGWFWQAESGREPALVRA